MLLEPTEPCGMDVVKEYKRKLYSAGIPVISYGSNDIYKTAAELKKKGVKFRKDPVQTDFGL